MKSIIVLSAATQYIITRDVLNHDINQAFFESTCAAEVNLF